MPSNRLHFKGDVRNADDITVGPSEDGRMFRPVAAEYDETADRSTVYYEEI